MCKFILPILMCIFSFNMPCAQIGYPKDPKPGMCYIQCKTEDTWREKNVQITKVPGYVKLEIVPAEFKTVTEQVLVKPAYKKLEIIPAVFKKVTDSIVIADNFNKLTIVPVEFIDLIEEVVTQPAYSKLETRTSIQNCKSKNPFDCVYLCNVEYPEQRIPFSVKKIGANENSTAQAMPVKKMAVIRDELVTEAHVKEIEIPAVYKSVQKRVLVKDATVRNIEVSPQYEKQTTRILEKKGSNTEWEEIDCKLTDFNVLPIYYALNSANLSNTAKDVINQKLWNLMQEKPGIKIEINSHTDSRNSAKYNVDLSQRRAQSVVDYLVSKGIARKRLVAKGYGESRFKDLCSAGANCTEEQHANKRRTEFRVLTN